MPNATMPENVRETVGYVLRLPDDRKVYLELPDEFVSRDRGGHLLLRPPAIRLLDRIRAIAMRNVTKPTPAYLLLLREVLELSQEAFGKAVGVDKMTVSRWERGTRKPSTENARKIAELREKRVENGVLLQVPSHV